MANIKYYCSNCENRFEAEEKDGVECPLCFWSSSVQKASESSSKTPKSAAATKKPALGGAAIPWGTILIGIGALLLLVLLVVFLIRFRQAIESKKVAIGKSESESAVEIPISNSQQNSTQTNLPTSMASTFSAEETAILQRRVRVSADRPMTKEEQVILAHQATFKTGFSEKLPSTVWTLEQFETMIKQQEKIFGVPLPGSYKRKLKKLFETSYLPASQSFEQGELLKARDGWLESLAFPIYANDIKKHRGVVLTMLRPFISDTLSKIGAINSSLVEKNVRDQERVVSEKYAGLSSLIEKQQWQESLAVITGLDALIDGLENPKLISSPAPNYPSAIARVDEDIRATLSAITEVPAPSVAAFDALRIDLAQKKQVVQSFMSNFLESAQKEYEEAMDLLQAQKWKEAELKLRGIDAPLALKQDAQEKLTIIRKIIKSTIPQPPLPPIPSGASRSIDIKDQKKTTS